MLFSWSTYILQGAKDTYCLIYSTYKLTYYLITYDISYNLVIKFVSLISTKTNQSDLIFRITSSKTLFFYWFGIKLWYQKNRSNESQQNWKTIIIGIIIKYVDKLVFKKSSVLTTSFNWIVHMNVAETQNRGSMMSF